MEPQPMDNSVPLRDGFNFTPIYRGKRIRMRITPKDMRFIDRLGRIRGFRGVVTDLDTNERYRVYGRACSLPHCMCDATIRKEPKVRL